MALKWRQKQQEPARRLTEATEVAQSQPQSPQSECGSDVEFARRETKDGAGEVKALPEGRRMTSLVPPGVPLPHQDTVSEELWDLPPRASSLAAQDGVTITIGQITHHQPHYPKYA